MKRMRIFSAILVLALSLGVLSGCGAEETPETSDPVAPTSGNFPNRAIIAETASSGSTVDTNIRIFTSYLTKYIGENVVVQNTSNFVEAHRDMLNLDPDGYTIAIGGNGNVINDGAGEVEFDTVNDVTNICSFAQGISSWIGIKTSLAEKIGVSTLEELIAYTQEHPDELTISNKINSVTAMPVGQLREAGLLAYPVDAGSNSDRMTAFLSDNLDIILISYANLQQYEETGEVLILASCSPERSEFSPHIPCTYELGYDVYFPSVYYLFGPKGLPADVVEKYNAAVQQVLEDEEFLEKLSGISMEPFYMNSDEVTEFIANQKEQVKRYN